MHHTIIIQKKSNHIIISARLKVITLEEEELKSFSCDNLFNHN